MSQNQLQDIFANCVERMAQGSSIESCLADYPDVAEELRPLLETAQATSRMGIAPAEMTAMRQRLDSQIEGLIQDTNFKPRRLIRFPTGTLVLTACLAVVFVGMMLLIPRDNTATFGDNPTATDASTVTEAPTEVTPTVISTETITPEATATANTEASCIVNSDWVAYQVRAGDSLSGIALNSGTTIEALQTGNCLGDSTIIIEGQSLLVPSLWEIAPPVNTNSSEADTNSSGGQGSQSSDSDDDDSDDDDSDDDDSDDDDD